MTERLYYHDAYVTDFRATVIACEPCPAAEGPRFSVVLDRTAFYPTSGGQPCDAGVLGGARVLDVTDREDGEVAHLVDAALAPGRVVCGVVDWPRRFEHMQQHTGQHVLSAAFDRLSGVGTESFHLGSQTCTIDLARDVSTREVSAAVDESNRIIWEDRPVAVRFVTPDEAARLPLRKEPARAGTLRLIEVEGFDLSACGGTHVARTGAIGIIAATGWEKVRGGSRLEFLCGVRVRRRFDRWRDAFAAAERHLSVAPEEMAGGIERLQVEIKAQQRALRMAHERLAAFEAREIVARGTRAGTRVVVAEAQDGWDAAGLKPLAVAAAAGPGVAAALFTTTSPARVVVAAHPQSGVDAAAALEALVATFGGKGGGKPDLAQGGGLVGTPDQLVAAARDLLSR
jgi:alanyl-tRNA synthetase